jgi:hypothetical protein
VSSRVASLSYSLSPSSASPSTIFPALDNNAFLP